jgi:hypothetical protein
MAGRGHPRGIDSKNHGSAVPRAHPHRRFDVESAMKERRGTASQVGVRRRVSQGGVGRVVQLG